MRVFTEAELRSGGPGRAVDIQVRRVMAYGLSVPELTAPMTGALLVCVRAGEAELRDGAVLAGAEP